MKKSFLMTPCSAVLMCLFLTANTSWAQLSCPPMPDKVTQVNRDVRSDVEVGVGSLGKLKAGQLEAKTDVIAKNLFDKYPNTDRLLIAQMMSATYCEMIRGSKTITETEKIRLWSEFSERVFKFENPAYNPSPAPSQPLKSARTTTPSETTTSGFLVPANELTPANPCGKLPADALLVLLGNSGSWGTRFPQTIISINDEPMLTMDQTAGRIAISGKFFSRDGKVVAELRDNEFNINPNNYFRKKRPDSHSLVVWDQQDVEVLNVRFINPHTIKFLGVIRHPKTELIISDNRGVFASTMCSGEARKAHFGFDVK